MGSENQNQKPGQGNRPPNDPSGRPDQQQGPFAQPGQQHAGQPQPAQPRNPGMKSPDGR